MSGGFHVELIVIGHLVCAAIGLIAGIWLSSGSAQYETGYEVGYDDGFADGESGHRYVVTESDSEDPALDAAIAGSGAATV